MKSPMRSNWISAKLTTPAQTMLASDAIRKYSASSRSSGSLNRRTTLSARTAAMISHEPANSPSKTMRRSGEPMRSRASGRYTGAASVY